MASKAEKAEISKNLSRLKFNDVTRQLFSDLLKHLEGLDVQKRTQVFCENREIQDVLYQIIGNTSGQGTSDPVDDDRLWTRRSVPLAPPNVLLVENFTKSFGTELTEFVVDGLVRTKQVTNIEASAASILIDNPRSSKIIDDFRRRNERKRKRNPALEEARTKLRAFAENGYSENVIQEEVEENQDKNQKDLDKFVDKLCDHLEPLILAIDISECYRSLYLTSSFDKRYEIQRWTEQHLRLKPTQFNNRDEGQNLLLTLRKRIADFNNLDEDAQTEVIALVHRLLDGNTIYWLFRLEFIMDYCHNSRNP